LVKRRRKHSKQIQANKILNQGIYIIKMITHKSMLRGAGSNNNKRGMRKQL
jgi:hypothetical protein